MTATSDYPFFIHLVNRALSNVWNLYADAEVRGDGQQANYI